MNNKIMEMLLFTAVGLSGFYAGTGFFVAMGGNPAIKLMSDNTFAEYWQHTDHFMAARMKIFGPLLLLTILFTTILLIKEFRTPSFWLMLAAFMVLIVDIAIAFSTNHPLNNLIQSWDLNNLPSNVQDIKWKVVHAFNLRLIMMIGTFLLVLLSVWLRKLN